MLEVITLLFRGDRISNELQTFCYLLCDTEACCTNMQPHSARNFQGNASYPWLFNPVGVLLYKILPHGQRIIAAPN
jgi:hypothetical protein